MSDLYMSNLQELRKCVNDIDNFEDLKLATKILYEKYANSYPSSAEGINSLIVNFNEFNLSAGNDSVIKFSNEFLKGIDTQYQLMFDQAASARLISAQTKEKLDKLDPQSKFNVLYQDILNSSTVGRALLALSLICGASLMLMTFASILLEMLA